MARRKLVAELENDIKVLKKRLGDRGGLIADLNKMIKELRFGADRDRISLNNRRETIADMRLELDHQEHLVREKDGLIESFQTALRIIEKAGSITTASATMTTGGD